MCFLEKKNDYKCYVREIEAKDFSLNLTYNGINLS